MPITVWPESRILLHTLVAIRTCVYWFLIICAAVMPVKLWLEWKNLITLVTFNTPMCLPFLFRIFICFIINFFILSFFLFISETYEKRNSSLLVQLHIHMARYVLPHFIWSTYQWEHEMIHDLCNIIIISSMCLKWFKIKMSCVEALCSVTDKYNIIYRENKEEQISGVI